MQRSWDLCSTFCIFPEILEKKTLHQTATHMKKAVMLFKGSKGAQFLFTAKYQNN
jgi:hypothetical protein